MEVRVGNGKKEMVKGPQPKKIDCGRMLLVNVRQRSE